VSTVYSISGGAAITWSLISYTLMSVPGFVPEQPSELVSPTSVGLDGADSGSEIGSLISGLFFLNPESMQIRFDIILSVS